MSCSINTQSSYGIRSVAQACADVADGDPVNDPASCSNGVYVPIGDPNMPCTKNYIVNNIDGVYGGPSISSQVNALPNSCFSCKSTSENYVHAPKAPWARPGSYLNLNQTWGGQKPFQL